MGEPLPVTPFAKRRRSPGTPGPRLCQRPANEGRGAGASLAPFPTQTMLLIKRPPQYCEKRERRLGWVPTAPRRHPRGHGACSAAGTRHGHRGRAPSPPTRAWLGTRVPHQGHLPAPDVVVTPQCRDPGTCLSGSRRSGVGRRGRCHCRGGPSGSWAGRWMPGSRRSGGTPGLGTRQSGGGRGALTGTQPPMASRCRAVAHSPPWHPGAVPWHTPLRLEPLCARTGITSSLGTPPIPPGAAAGLRPHRLVAVMTVPWQLGTAFGAC